MSNSPRSALLELTSARVKEWLREPEALFWSLGFPILLAVGLGIAFRNRPPEAAHIAVSSATPRAADVTRALRADSGLVVEQLPQDSALLALYTGRLALVVQPGADGGVTYIFDDTRPDSRTARFLANDALQRGAGRRDPVPTNQRIVRERGARYIDFVVPGLLGMNIMGGAVWGVGFTIVDQRRKNLLKRLIATPMSRTAYLASYLLSRIGLLIVETVLLLGITVALFGVPMRGSLLVTCAIIVLAAFSFGGLGLLIASRARTIEGVSGLMNASMLPMWVLSGVFFSSENFPKVVQPFIQALPLTAANNALRANMLRGTGFGALTGEMGILAAWMIVCFALALRLFRWR